MSNQAAPDVEADRRLRREAMELMQRLPVDPADAERVLVYAHELLAFINATDTSPCATCDRTTRINRQAPPVLTLVTSP